MKKLVRFLLFVIIMIITASCTTTSYVESYDDPIYSGGRSYYGSFNPYGYNLSYSSNWGYYYYDSYRTRFLFDDYICYHYPHLRNGNRSNHWDYQNYNQNHSFNSVNSNRNYTQKNGRENNSSTRQSVQRSTQNSRQQNVQSSTPTRRTAPNSVQQNVQKSNSTRSTYQQSPASRQNVQRSAPARSNYQRSPAVTKPSNQRSGSYGRRR